MGELVATMVVGPLLSILKDKVSSSLLDQYKVMKGMEEQHEILMRKLPAILDIITDAEQAAAHREGVAAWLQAIKKVAYQASEVFDEFKYEALRRKAKREGHYKELGFDVVKLFPTHNRFIFRNRMGRKLCKIVQAIEVLVTEMNAFGFEYKQQPPVSNGLRQKDHVIFDPNEITSKSRGEDNKEIVDRLVGQANNADLTVLPVVGMGGLGKTTLAQLVYNEPEIQNHFDLLLWVCVSECFDVDSLAKSIVEAAPEKKDDGTKADPKKKDDDTKAAASKKKPLDSLQNVVSGQRYLLVLDDVWKRQVHIWEELKARLQHGGRGSAVLTTTRDKDVAEIMGTVIPHDLKALEDKYIKEIIETRAFSRLHKEQQRPPKLVKMVDEIVKRCHGSPLAATALGFVLCTKTTKKEWEDVSKQSSICTKESGILAILKLSYNDLPSHMKQCFAFCAIFPKDYEIDVDKLIRLWIAHGFIHEKHGHPESIGKQIFDELASRSFFQDVKQDQVIFEKYAHPLCYSRTTCKIHDLMHDVALSVMEKECALATEEPGKIECVIATEEPSQSEWLPNTARHLFLSCKEPGRKLNNSLKDKSPAIETLMCDSDMHSSFQHLSKYSSLKALQLNLQQRSLYSSFPLKPKHLHHMRYLDLSRSDIKTLPEDISILYNLQTLNLSGCEFLRGLPRQMKYMAALRHLYTHGCKRLEKMPRDLRKLTSLQTLTCFVAGKGSKCSNVGELGNLNLGGLLELHNLLNVTEKAAEAANLMNKQELRELTFRWTDGLFVWKGTSCADDARVLEKLKPHDGLHAISILFYRGTTFPTWMVTMQNLKELTLKHLACLERWPEVDNDREKIMFPRLEKLCIDDCGKLTELPGHQYFPSLQKARIWRCPELTTTAKSPKLSVLEVTACEVELFLWVDRHITSLTNLTLQSTEYSTETAFSAQYGLREVLDSKEKLNDHDFPLSVLELISFKSDVTELCACFVHLQDLTIFGCDALIHWPEKLFEGLVFLRKLIFGDCHNLTGYAQAPAEASTSSETSQLLPSLESLRINNCESLVEVFNVPASLRTMEIYACYNLTSIYGRRLQQGQSESSIHQGLSSILEVSSSSLGGRDLTEHLGELMLWRCDRLTGVLHLPQSLKKLEITACSGLTSLETRSGELTSLKSLRLTNCHTLSSLPNGPQAYSSLQDVCISRCPSMETLPKSLQQRLGSIQRENIYCPNYYEDTPRPIPSLVKPKTWKYAICRD